MNAFDSAATLISAVQLKRMILDPANDKWNNSNHVLLRLAGFHFSRSTVQLSLPSKMYISGLPHHYIAAQLHFHWGSANKPGAEHTLDGEQAVAEVNTASSSVFFLILWNGCIGKLLFRLT